MTYRYPTHEPNAAEIRKDHTSALSMLTLILAVCAVLMPGIYGALHMASDWYGAQAKLHQEAFVAAPRGGAGRASLVAEAR